MKVLITADIHFGDYNDYNYSEKSRLKQFDLLADTYVELGKKHGCKELWIAGDFLRVPNNRSKQIHRFKKFIKTICDNFETVRYILGQHDLDSKSDNQSIEDTIVSLFDYENFIFSNKVIHNFDGTTVAFMSWSPSQDLSWIEDKVDILIGHYTKSTFFGQEIDEDKFDLMIHGDIHNDQVLGKFVSIGNPIQHDMSSQAEGTCVLLDTATKEWCHIKTDPDHSKFLQMKYVNEQILEGFQGPLTYNIFRPVAVSNTEGLVVDVPQWKEIAELINNMVIAHSFEDIHSEVESKCVPYSEVDFNFQLKSLEVVGYRSVVYFKINFDSNDRIVLLGKNGSGKSSIIRALKAIFEKSRYMMEERSDLTDNIQVTLSLYYQNKLFEISKGDEYEFKIDGVQQEFNNKSQFENELPQKLPFFDYADLFFVTSDIQNLAAKFTPDRRIELISKFYRLDRIDAFSQTALNLHYEVLASAEPIKEDLIKETGALENIKSRLEELKDMEEVDIEDLKRTHESYKNLRDGYQKYKDWESENDKKKYKKAQVESTVKTYRQRMTINLETTQDDLNKIIERLEKLKSKKTELTTKWNRLKELKPLESSLLNKGLSLKQQLDDLENGKCPTCGNKINDSKSKEMISQITSELEKTRDDYSKVLDELNEFTEEEKTTKDYFKLNIEKCTKFISEAETEKDLLQNKITQYNIAKGDFDKENEKLTTLSAEYDEFLKTKVDEVKLPPNISDLEYDIVSQINKKESYESEKIKLSEKSAKIEELKSQISELQSKANRYYEYVQLTSRTGVIYEEILKRLAQAFSESDIKYEVQTWEARNTKYIAFNSYYKVKKQMRIYEQLSDGQKSVCDLDFFSKLFSVRVGLLVLDEHLKHLDEDNLPKAAEILSKMNVNTLLLSTHDPNFSNYTKRILLQLNEKGETESTIL